MKKYLRLSVTLFLSSIVSFAQIDEWVQYGGGNGEQSMSSKATLGTFPLTQKWSVDKTSHGGLIPNSTIFYGGTNDYLIVSRESSGPLYYNPDNGNFIDAVSVATNDWFFNGANAILDNSYFLNNDIMGHVDIANAKYYEKPGFSPLSYDRWDNWGLVHVDTKTKEVYASSVIMADQSYLGGWAPIAITRYEFQVDEIPRMWQFPNKDPDKNGAVNWNSASVNTDRSFLDNSYLLMGDKIISSHKIKGAATFSSGSYWPNGIYGLKKVDGNPAWNILGDWGGISSDGKFVYCVKNSDKKLYCIDGNGNIIWSSMALDAIANHPPAVKNGVVVVVTDNGSLYAFDTNGNGSSTLWTGTLGGGAPFASGYINESVANLIPYARQMYYSRSVMAIANDVLVLANNTSIKALNLATGLQIWNTTWNAGSYGPVCNPIIAKNRLYVNSNSRVACFEGTFNNYTLTVNTGSGDGTRAAGSNINIMADVAPMGQVFDKWTGDVSSIEDIFSSNTIMDMPAKNASITATYKTIIPVQTIDVSPKVSQIYARLRDDYDYPQQIQLKATLNPLNSTENKLVWTSSNPSIANVNSLTGEVHAGFVNGEVTITCTSESGKIGTSKVTVSLPRIVALRQSPDPDYDVFQLDDNDPQSCWYDQYATSSRPVWVMWNNPIPVVWNSYVIKAQQPWGSTMYDPRSWIIQGSNDGSSWTTLDTRNNETFTSANKTYNFANNAAYSYYRWYVSATSGGGGAQSIQVSTFKFSNTSNIAPTSLTINPSSGLVPVYTSTTIVGTILPNNTTNKNVMYTSSNVNIAYVNNYGEVTGVSPGVVTISGVADTDATKKGICVITVTNGAFVSVSGLVLNPSTKTITIASSFVVAASVNPSNATNSNVIFASNNTNVASVNPSSGLVSGLLAGIATITGTTQSGGFKSICVVTVVSGPPALSANPNNINFLINGGVQNINLISNVYWTIANNQSWLSLSSLTGSGNATINVTATTNNSMLRTAQITFIGVGGLSQIINITQTGIIPVAGVSVSPTTISIQEGMTSTLGANVMPTNATNANINWTSSDANIATVNNMGNVNAIAPGVVTITAITQDGGFASIALVTVTAIPPLPTIYIPSSKPIINGILNESAWQVTTIVNKLTSGSAPNNTITFGALWDNNYLYVAVNVLDNNLFAGNANPWDDDAIEFFIDANNSKGNTYDAFDFQFAKSISNALIWEANNRKAGVMAAVNTLSGGFTMEVAFPWSVLGVTPFNNMTLGFDLANDDNDAGTGRTRQSVWKGNANNWSNTSTWGTILLSNQTVGGAAASLVVSPSTQTHPSAGATQAASVLSNLNWTITGLPYWITSNITNGANNGTINFTTANNTSTGIRTATINVSSQNPVIVQTITITQTGAAASLVVSPSTQTHPSSGATQAASVLSNLNWTITGLPYWITSNITNGANNGTINFTTANNTSTGIRTATINVSSQNPVIVQTITITQTGAAASLVVSPSTQTHPSSGATQAASVLSNLNWTITGLPYWITSNITNGANNGTINFTTANNTSTGIRTATINVSSQNPVVVQTITITQTGAAASLIINPSALNYVSTGGIQVLSITSNLNWSISGLPSWLSVATTSGFAHNQVVFTANANNTISGRSATIMVSSSNPVITQTLNITQSGASEVLIVNTNTLNFPSSGNISSINITANTPWTINNIYSWLSISGISGSGNGAISVVAFSNSSVTGRSGSFTITGTTKNQIVSVNQNASSAVLTLTSSNLSFASAVATQTFNILTNSNWVITSSGTWLAINPTSGNSNATITITASANLSTFPRSTQVLVSVPGSVQYISVNQAGATPYTIIQPANINYNASGGLQVLTITSNTNWTISKNLTWATIDVVSGTGNGFITINAISNTGINALKGSITFSDGINNQMANLTLSGATPTLSMAIVNTNTFAAQGGVLTFVINSNSDWNLSGLPSWATVNVLNNFGNQTITITALNNPTTTTRNIQLSLSGIANNVVFPINQLGAVPVLSPNFSSIHFLANDIAQVLSITSNIDWSLSVLPTWISVSTLNGFGDGSMSILPQENTSTTTRTYNLTIVGANVNTYQIVSITQAGATPILNITPNTQIHPSSGQTQTLIITSNTSWTISGIPSWLTPSKSNGLNDETIDFTTAANTTSEARIATISITTAIPLITQSITITQSGVNPTVNIGVGTANFTALGGSQTITISSNSTWSVLGVPTWVTINPATGFGNGVITLTAPLNQNINPNTGIITITSGSISQTLILNQTGGASILSASPSVIVYATSGGSQIINITSNTNWTILGLPTWLVPSQANGFGNTTISLLCQTNSLSVERAAMITVSAPNFIQSQAIYISQAPLASATGINYINPSSAELLVVIPNPVENTKIIKFNKYINFVIYDLLGHKMASSDGLKLIEYPLGSLPVGIYFLKTTENEVRKLIIK